jgi:hypothetical protein
MKVYSCLNACLELSATNRSTAFTDFLSCGSDPQILIRPQNLKTIISRQLKKEIDVVNSRERFESLSCYSILGNGFRTSSIDSLLCSVVVETVGSAPNSIVQVPTMTPKSWIELKEFYDINAFAKLISDPEAKLALANSIGRCMCIELIFSEESYERDWQPTGYP